jgi:PadR family transcriptional regulator, regulatory protein AphA
MLLLSGVVSRGMAPVALTTTAYAILGQLALRPWSMYDMTKNIRRTLHWFWPRAESLIYAEAKRLVAAGLAQAESQPVGTGGKRTVYAITRAGQDALEQWLSARPAEQFSLHFEPLLRVHLAPYGSRDALLAAIDQAQAAADSLLVQAVTIGQEFVEGRHQFQHQVHMRALLFDALWNLGLSLYVWAVRSRHEVEGWRDLELTPANEQRALAVIREALERLPTVANRSHCG